jgi:hypothetical protein
MPKYTAVLTVTLVLIAASSGGARASATRRLSRAELENKIRGGWAGQMIGVSYGAPTEFRSNGRIIDWQIAWAPDDVSNSIGQDDLYVEMTFAEVLDSVGLDATSEQFGDMFKNSRYELWHANASARRLLNNGIKAPLSGDPRYNAHANDIDFQIESDFIGLMTPGLAAGGQQDRRPRRPRHELRRRPLRRHVLRRDVRGRVLRERPAQGRRDGAAVDPGRQRLRKIIADVLKWSAENPKDWQKTWRLITEKWDRDDPCPDGALDDFNIDARLNGAFVALGLLYGERDFTKTLEVSARAGQDSDCNPSSAAGILGVMLGYDQIPDQWKSGIPKLADTKFAYTRYSFNEITASTVARALKVIQRAGGTVSNTEVVVPPQEPKAPKLEQWAVDAPTEKLEATSGAWTWGTGWEGASSTQPGSGVTLQFTGTGVLVIGNYTDKGGRAEVLLDNQKAGEINAKKVPNTNDNVYWFVTGLKGGAHTVTIRVLPSEAGGLLRIVRAVVYGK